MIKVNSSIYKVRLAKVNHSLVLDSYLTDFNINGDNIGFKTVFLIDRDLDNGKQRYDVVIQNSFNSGKLSDGYQALTHKYIGHKVNQVVIVASFDRYFDARNYLDENYGNMILNDAYDKYTFEEEVY